MGRIRSYLLRRKYLPWKDSVDDRGRLRFATEADLSQWSVKQALRIIKSEMGRRKRGDYFCLEIGVYNYDLIDSINIAKKNKFALHLSKDLDWDEWQITVLRVGHEPFETVFYSAGA